MASSLRRNTTAMMVGLTVRSVLQALYFVLIARTLGINAYGVVVAVGALANIVAPFASLGQGNLLIRDATRGAERVPSAWGRCLAFTAAAGVALVALVAPVAGHWLIRAPIGVCILLLTADVIFNRMVEVAGQFFQGAERLNRTAALQVFLSGARCGAAIVFAATGRGSLAVWSWHYVGATAAVAIGAVTWVTFICRPTLTVQGLAVEAREGFYFASALSLQAVYNDADKTILAREASVAETGCYGAAYRIVDVVFTPYRAFIYAAYPQLFRFGNAGQAAVKDFALRCYPATLVYGLLAGIGLFVAAPLITPILGGEYRDAVIALRWLAPLPLIRAMHYLAADALAGAGRQRMRVAAQAVVAAFNIVACVPAIQLWSWRGAALVAIASDALLAISLWRNLLRASRVGELANGSFADRCDA